MQELLTTDQQKQLLQENQELKTDMRLVKSAIEKICDKIGLINPDGTFRETVNMKALMSIGMGLMSGGDKLAQEFSFLADLKPLIEKYKEL